MAPEFTIVTACTPDYAESLKWSLSTWLRKPQFRDRRGIVFIHDMKRLPFDLPPNWRVVPWTMEGDGMTQREMMISAFILGAAREVTTTHFVKLDADCYFTDAQDVFAEEDFKLDLCAQKWSYTKPGYWVDKMTAWINGVPPPPPPPAGEHWPRHHAPRIISYCCLHKTAFVIKAAELAGARLPVPSHDSYLWFLADHCSDFKWAARDLKSRGVRHEKRWKKIRNEACANDGAWEGPALQELFDHIQLEITWACNLACPNCDRCCGTAPSKERLALEQVKQFVADSQAAGHFWRRIDILGGEPTLHPDLLAILDAVRPIAKRVRLTTNGTGPFVEKVLATIPDWVIVRNSHDKKESPNFEAFNAAPNDVSGAGPAQACSIPWRCGLAFTPRGYFLCGSGAAVARVFGIPSGIDRLGNMDAPHLRRQRQQLCNYCGHSRSVAHRTDSQELSPSWKKALEEYNAH